MQTEMNLKLKNGGKKFFKFVQINFFFPSTFEIIYRANNYRKRLFREAWYSQQDKNAGYCIILDLFNTVHSIEKFTA